MAETATLTLTDFLLARIVEDETLASGPEWWHDGEGNHGRTGRVPFADPAPVLAECEAKRRIISYADLLIRGREHDMFDDDRAADANVYLRALAAVYADHPDYRDEWRP